MKNLLQIMILASICMALPLINIATEVLLRTSEVRYYLNFLLAGTLIYMSMMAIRQWQPAGQN